MSTTQVDWHVDMQNRRAARGPRPELGPKSGLLAFIYHLYRGRDPWASKDPTLNPNPENFTFADLFRSSADSARACMDEFGLTEEQRRAVFAAGLDPVDPPNPWNMRPAADGASMTALGMQIVAEMSDASDFNSAW